MERTHPKEHQEEVLRMKDKENLKAERLAALRNRDLRLAKAKTVESSYRHFYLIEAELWDIYAEELLERIKEL